MRNGEMVNNWIDSLQAAWPGIQVTRYLLSHRSQMAAHIKYGFYVYCLIAPEKQKNYCNDALELLSIAKPVHISLANNQLKACAQRFRYALFAFIHTQTYFEYYTLTLRLASLVKKNYATEKFVGYIYANSRHVPTFHSQQYMG